MEGIEEAGVNWFDDFDFSQMEFTQGELPENCPPIISSPPSVEESQAGEHCGSINISKLIYSGPTISNIERALSISNCQPPVSLPDKGLGKMDHKYIMRIKTCGNGLEDDGYKWRKYGQKTIKNSLNPRSYYRCTNPRCNAKKQVERSMEDPETLIVTYDGLHLHYTYSHLLFPRSPDISAAAPEIHVAKKLKCQPKAETARPISAPLGVDADVAPLHGIFEDGSEGLLEDVVPLLVRKPCGSNASSYDQHSSASSPTSHSSLSWATDSGYFDLGILSSIL